MKVLTVVGARPQFVKAAAVMRTLDAAGLAEVMVHTGQHYDPELSEIFFSELSISPPRHNLDIHDGTHGTMTGRMLAALEQVIVQEQAAIVLVYGDTNSTLAGALAAAKLDVPIAHVEAGLRSFNRQMPEEINRVVVDHVSTLLFCPTSTSVANLASEGVTNGVHLVGDVMYDAALHAGKVARTASQILDELAVQDGEYAVATIHRAENTDDAHRLKTLLAYLREQAGSRRMVFPMHPRTRAAVARHDIDTSSFVVISPLGYLDMTRLLQGATSIYTDSGGLQKEAYFHRVPCVTLRDETEWIETISCGWNRLWTESSYSERRTIEEYGDGTAAEKITALLQKFLTS